MVGSEYLLSLRPGRRPWLLCLLLLPWLVACARPSDGKDVNPVGEARTTSGIDRSVLASLVRSGARATTDAPSSVAFPRDLGLHPESTGESVLFQFIAPADQHLIALQLQLDRVALARTAGSGSAWDYRDVLASRLMFEHEADSAAVVRTGLQRVALGLAESDEQQLSSGALVLQVAPPAQSSMSGGRAVRDSIGDGSAPEAGQSGTQSVSGACAMDWSAGIDLPATARLFSTGPGTTTVAARDDSLGTALTLRLVSRHCPDAATLGGLSRWQWQGLPASLTVSSESLPTRVLTGHAWLSNRWGGPGAGNDIDPDSSPVVIDTAFLVLRSGSQETTRWRVDRSKRRSGRGPRTVQAMRQLDSDTVATPVSIAWRDIAGDTDAEPDGPPGSIILTSADGRVDLTLAPLTSPVVSQDLYGRHWRGAVRVRGSHEGYGFVDYRMPRE